VASGGGKINREEIAAIVDRFLAGRRPEEFAPTPQPVPARPIEAEAGSMYSGPGSRENTAPRPDNGERSGAQATMPVQSSATTSNGRNAVDFVSEDDVRRAIQKGEKIYINAKTIITPAARDIGEPAEVFAKG
jgi:hypothetical protein